MSGDLKEIVKEKYGQAALRVRGTPAGRQLLPSICPDRR
jgi:hypothetical protein